MSKTSNFISDYSPFKIEVTLGSWQELLEYKDEYADVIETREMNRMAFGHRSPQMTYREYLVNYLKQVAAERRLTHCTLHLAVYMMDIFMDHHSIDVDRLLLVANCCLLIAAKLEECSTKTPKIVELNSHVQNSFSVHNYKQLEAHILQFFDWKIMIPTAAHYIHYYLNAAICQEDILSTNQKGATILREMHLTIRTYLDKIIDDIHYMQLYRPSMLAASIIAIVRSAHDLDEWPQQLQEFTRYDCIDIHHCKMALLQSLPLVCKECELIN